MTAYPPQAGRVVGGVGGAAGATSSASPAAPAVTSWPCGSRPGTSAVSTTSPKIRGKRTDAASAPAGSRPVNSTSARIGRRSGTLGSRLSSRRISATSGNSASVVSTARPSTLSVN